MRTDDLLLFLDAYFAGACYPPSERGGIYRRSDREVRRVGLALEPDIDLNQWVTKHTIDALWLHRPWQLTDDHLQADASVVYHHLPFDETLTMGFNRPLAEAIAMLNLEALGYKQARDTGDELLPRRAIGMLGDVTARCFADWQQWITRAFGGYERAESGQQDTIARLAVVGAMNDALIREAADRGIDLYLTGQYRKSAQAAVDETGVAVIAVGHRRSEEWGLRTLATVLRQQFPTLEIDYKKSGQP